MIGSYEYELSPLKKGNNNVDNVKNINSFLQKIKNIRAGTNLNEISIYSDKYANRNNKKVNFKIDENLQYQRLNNSYDSGRSKSAIRLDKELQKKTKTILRKNIVGRFKRSPYIKSYEN